MPLVVRAEVFDINVDLPQPNEQFWVDSNVWFWFAYPRVSLSESNEIRQRFEPYERYVRKMLHVGAALHWSPVSFAELAHSIERAERMIYMRAQSLDDLGTKTFRHNTKERPKVVSQIVAAWLQIEAISRCLDSAIGPSEVQEALGSIQGVAMDGHDALMLANCRAAGVLQFLTDDGDFAGVPDISLFTANQAVLSAAKKQGKLRRVRSATTGCAD